MALMMVAQGKWWPGGVPKARQSSAIKYFRSLASVPKAVAS